LIRLSSKWVKDSDPLIDIGLANQVTTYDFALYGDMTVTPEPSTYALMATGLAGIVGIARRRKSAA